MLMLTMNFVGESLMSRLSVHLMCLESLLKVKSNASHNSLLWFTGSYQCIQIIVSCAQCTPCKASLLVSFLLWFTGSMKCWGLAWLKWFLRLVSSQAFRVSWLLLKELCEYCRYMMYWEFLSHMKFASLELIFPECQGITQPIQIFEVPRFCRWMIAKISFDDNFLLVQHLLHTCIQRAIVFPTILSHLVPCLHHTVNLKFFLSIL